VNPANNPDPRQPRDHQLDELLHAHPLALPPSTSFHRRPRGLPLRPPPSWEDRSASALHSPLATHSLQSHRGLQGLDYCCVNGRRIVHGHQTTVTAPPKECIVLRHSLTGRSLHPFILHEAYLRRPLRARDIAPVAH
jgi:hypothetical protein